MKKLMISACLMGINCRYDGGNTRLSCLNELKEQFELIPVCPETLAGLPCPRHPLEISKDRVYNNQKEDMTEVFHHGADLAMKVWKEAGCPAVLLQSRSPSCGKGLIYDGSLEHLKDTYGKKRSISFVVKDCNKINLKELLESYSFHKEAVEMEMEEEESTINFTFDKNAVAVSDIIAYVMDVTEVKDMNIRETDLGEIVKEIYHNGMSVEDGEA